MAGDHNLPGTPCMHLASYLACTLHLADPCKEQVYSVTLNASIKLAYEASWCNAEIIR